MSSEPPAPSDASGQASEPTPPPETAPAAHPAQDAPAPADAPEAVPAERAPAAAEASEAVPAAPAPEEARDASGDAAWAAADAERATSEPGAADAAATASEGGPAPDATAEAAAADAHEHEEEAPAVPVRRAGKRANEAARAAALARLAAAWHRLSPAQVEACVVALEKGADPVFLGRFRRETTGGLDERRLRDLRDEWRDVRAIEERRAALLELLESRGALSPTTAERLARTNDVHAMEDLAAPWLPVHGGRATVARGHGLQALADAIRGATRAEGAEPPPLSDLAKPFVKEGTDVPSLDAALAGARDILAEEICLDAGMRTRLREAFRRFGVLTVGARGDAKAVPPRHAGLVGFTAPAHKVPPLKLLAVRRGEKERALASSIEPPEDRALPIVHGAVAGDHPYAGFLRAAAEDGYRRILKPGLQAEVRADLKARADGAAFDVFERSLRNLLLGPVGGPRKTLGILPDVAGGHRLGAVDEAGRPVHFGRLPHEATAGREAALASLRTVLVDHGIEAVAVGTCNGRREAISLVEEARKDLGREVFVAEVSDGGTRALEAAAIAKPVRIVEGGETVISPDSMGALSLARRFQDPLAEYARIDPHVLGLGPHVHDVNQGRLAELFDGVFASCLGHCGVDATTADADLLRRVPGLDRARAKAFVAWRDAGGRLEGKAGLAAVEGVGMAAAERAVGFLRIAGAKDPRDRTLLHPEQYGLVDEMAAQVGVDVPTLFRDPRARARVDLGRLTRPDAPLHVLKYVLYQVTAGLADPRPRWANPVRPPPDVTIQSIRPGLWLEGRVTRAVPFGVFVDVGLGAEALIPLPHVGDRPGLEPSTVAPVGAVVTARVLEIDVAKRRLTLTMRPDRDVGMRLDGPRRDVPRGRGPAREGAFAGAGASRGGDRGPGRGPARGPEGLAPRSGDRPPDRAGGRFPRREGAGAAPRGGGAGAPSGAGAGDGRARGAGGPRPAGGGGGGGRGFGGPGGGAKSGVGMGMGRATAKRPEGDRFGRDDPSAPRRISLPMDAPPPAPAEVPVDESALTPEQVLAKKLEELRKRLSRPS